MSDEMRRAPELLAPMVDRYAGPPMELDELRAGDAREAPEAVRRAHAEVRDEEIAGVHCTWLDPGLRDQGLLVSLHGGGYWVGPGALHWEWFSTLCRATGRAGLLIRYARAPEATYPLALEQSQAVARTLDGPWWLVGDSAGAALGVALAARLRGTPHAPRGMVLSSPWMDITMRHPQMLANQHLDVMLGVPALDRYAAGYAGATDRAHPELSPLNLDPAGLPPMLVTVGTAELFLWEIRDWARACAAAGTPCEVIEVEGAIHDFAIMLALLPEAREVLPGQVAFLQRTA